MDDIEDDEADCCNIRSTADVLAFIADLPVPTYLGVPKPDERTPLERALWWAAYRTAEQYVGDFTTRDWAELLLKPWGGFKTEDDLHNCVIEYFNDPDNPTDEEAEQLYDDLEGFWCR